MLDEAKEKMTVKTTTQVETRPTTATRIETKATTQSSAKNPAVRPTTFKPFLGVKVVEEMEPDVFEDPSSKSSLQRSTTQIQPKATTQQPSTKKVFKSLTEKLSSARREFTTPSAPTRKTFPVVQNAVPLFNASDEKTTYVPTWRRTKTTVKL
jgi:hypothetical protein